MKTKTGRLLSLLLTIVMALSILPISAFAAETTVTAPVITEVYCNVPSNLSVTLPQYGGSFTWWIRIDEEATGAKRTDPSITYQWYYNSENSYEGATPITQDMMKYDCSYDLSPTSLSISLPGRYYVPGKTYYFCDVTHTTEAGSATSRTEIVSNEVILPDPVPYGIVVGEEAIGRVNVTIEDTTPQRTDLLDRKGQPLADPGPIGKITSRNVEIFPSDNMMTVIARALLLANIPQEGAESGYIRSINGREEFDRGSGSGWMGTLNGWFPNEGFQNYSVANGQLKAEDAIRVMYTTDLGKDIGGGFGTETDKRLKTLKVVGSANPSETAVSLADPVFDPDVHTYTASFSSSAKIAHLQLTPMNAHYQVRAYAGEQEYRMNANGIISVPFDDAAQIEIRVVVGDPAWPGSGDASAEEYTIYACKSQEILISETVGKRAWTTCAATGVQTDVTTFSFQRYNNGDKYLPYTASLYYEINSDDPNYRQDDLTMQLTGLPETAAVDFVSPDGKTVYPFVKQGNTWTLELKGFLKQNNTKYVRDWIVRMTDGQTSEVYRMTIQCRNAVYASSLNITPSPAYSEVINGQPEGTFFPLDGEGNETGAVGFDTTVRNYNIYVMDSIQSVYLSTLNGASSSDFGEIWVDGEPWLEKQTIVSLKKESKLKPIVLHEGTTTVQIRLTSKKSDHYYTLFTLNFIQKKISPAEIEAKILTLPGASAITWDKYHEQIEALAAQIGRLSEETRAEISADALAKLAVLSDEVTRQHETGLAMIRQVVSKIAEFQDQVTAENCGKYAEAIREAKRLENNLAGWVYTLYTSDYNAAYRALQSAFKLLNRHSIVNGAIGTAIDYEDDFMLPANAFNLTMGTRTKVTFTDYIISCNANGMNGEGAVPWNLPGRFEFTIADPSVFRIETEQSEYVDSGLGGGSAYPDELYYLVPLKEGTTTFTVRLKDEVGTYYGQIPEMIVHVNSDGEASVEKLTDKLTNISSLPHTTKYDTWHFWEGTEGAPFTFRVNGSNAKVSVYNYLSDNKTEYPVMEDGSVTVLLKDGYNPIEVSADFEGQRMTQVYGLRGKAISYAVTNLSVPGMPLREGNTARVLITGLNTPVRKILRIYNPSGTTFLYDTDLNRQSVLRSGGGQYQAGYLEFELTNAGTVHLTNGRITQRWWGSSLGSEGTQGNTGGIASQDEYTFSEIPDIVLTDVQENPDYKPETVITPVIDGGNTVEAGQTVTIRMDGLDINEITALYPMETTSTTTHLQGATTFFGTTIPGVTAICSPSYDNQSTTGVKYPLSAITTITFTVPADTPAGTYRIKGGYVRVMAGDPAWGIHPHYMFEKQFADLEITVTEHQPADIDSICRETGDWLESLGTPYVGSVGGEWMVIGLARSGRAVSEEYYARVVEYVKNKINDKEQLHRYKSTDNSRIILALTALGYDVTDVGGHNLLAGLNDLDYVEAQGVNGPIWALIAFDSHNYEIPQGTVTREALIASILKEQFTDGGWSIWDTSDPDMTGMALQALAPYYSTNEEVKAAVDKALVWLSEAQNADGGYSSTDGPCAESAAQVITALTAFGIDPQKDARFIKNGRSVLDALCAYRTDGGFRHTMDGEQNGMATEQAYYALVSYLRLKENKTNLYDMSDVTIRTEGNQNPSEDPSPKPDDGAGSDPNGGVKNPPTADKTDPLLYFGMTALSTIGFAAVFAAQNHKKKQD